MPRIKNRNSVPSVPIDWRSGKHSVRWNTATEPFDVWVGKVWRYCDGNGLPKPTEDDLDQLACTQFPGWVCDGNKQATGRALEPAGTGRGRCGSCGGGHR